MERIEYARMPKQSLHLIYRSGKEEKAKEEIFTGHGVEYGKNEDKNMEKEDTGKRLNIERRRLGKVCQIDEIEMVRPRREN